MGYRKGSGCGGPLVAAGCRHVVAWSAGGVLTSPLHGRALPLVPPGIGEGDLTDERLLAAFGDLAPLLDEYWQRADWRQGFDPDVLWLLLVEHLRAEVTAATLAGGALDAGHAAGGAERLGRGRAKDGAAAAPQTAEIVWWSPEPARALAEIEALLDALGDALALLASQSTAAA
jgi:hypothetical protein